MQIQSGIAATYSAEGPATADRLRPGLSASAERLGPIAYGLFRIVSGAMFACHGMQKVLGLLGSDRVPFGSQLWIGGMIELLAGLLIAAGLFTRPAAFVASGTMAVAYLQFHWKLAIGAGMWLPIVNKGELAVLYSFAFLLFAASGSGPLSIDGRRHSRRD
jgi:putative oxidoreductase